MNLFTSIKIDWVTAIVYGVSILICLIPVIFNLRQLKTIQGLSLQSLFLIVNTLGFSLLIIYILYLSSQYVFLSPEPIN